MNNKLTQEIEDYKPQILRTKLKANYSLFYWKVRKFAYDLPLKYINCSKAEKSLLESSSLLCTCFVIPDAISADRLLLLVEIMCFYLFLEDQYGFEKTTKGYNGLLAVINSKKVADSPLEKFIKYLMDKIKLNYTDEQFEFFRDCFHSLLDSSKNETVSQNQELINVEDIIESRLNTNGAKLWYSLIEFELNISIHKYFGDNRLTKFVELMNKHTTYVNDIYSLKKELHQNPEKNELKHSVIYYYYRNGNSIEKSVDIIREKIEEIENEMIELKTQLTIDNSDNLDFIKVLDAIEYMASGNLWFHFYAPRYNLNNKIAINKIFTDCDHFVELRDEFDPLTFNHNKFNSNIDTKLVK